GSEENGATVGEVDVGLGDRLAASVLGKAIVQDHPLFGTGLGSWLHAFRPYQAPPVEGGIWDHAHNDYLELVAASGIVGALLVLSGRRQLAGGTFSLCLLLVLFTLAAAPQVVNRVLLFGGAAPLSAQDCVDRADTLLAEEGDGARGQALVLVRRALDRSPAD